jgi:hypothetical protein
MSDSRQPWGKKGGEQAHDQHAEAWHTDRTSDGVDGAGPQNGPPSSHADHGKTLKVNIVSSAHRRQPAPCCGPYRENVPVGVRLAKRSEWVREGTPDVIDGANSRYTEFEALAGIIPVFRFDPNTP